MEKHHKVLGQLWVILFIALGYIALKDIFALGSWGTERIPFSLIKKMTDCWPGFSTGEFVNTFGFNANNGVHYSFDERVSKALPYNVGFYIVALLITVYYIFNKKFSAVLFKGLMAFSALMLVFGFYKLYLFKAVNKAYNIEGVGDYAYYSFPAIERRTFWTLLVLLIIVGASLWVLFKKHKQDDSVDFSHLQS